MKSSYEGPSQIFTACRSDWDTFWEGFVYDKLRITVFLQWVSMEISGINHHSHYKRYGSILE